MKRINILFILIILLAFSQFSYSQTPPSFDWMRHAGGTDYDDGWGVGTDANGNVYVTGGFKYSATFGSTTITSYGGRDMFLAKYNPNGNLVWLKHGGSSIDNDRGRAIATNAAGFSAVAGYFYVNGTFGNINLVGNGDYDVFIAVYNPNGNCIWANAIGGPYYEEETYGVCIDDNSNVYITGMFMGTINVAQGTTLTSYGGYDAFVIKFNSSGNFQWAKKIGGTSDDIGYDIIADSNGDVCVTGGFEYSATFETGTTITGNGGDDIFLAKYDTNGNLIWAKNAGGTNYETAKGITVDNSDNFYIAGYYAGTATFDTATITSHIAMYSTSYSQDVFIAKYNNSGDLIWLQTAGGQRDNWANGIAVDALGNVSIAGVMEGDMYFGTYFLENNAPGVNFAYEDPFIAHYDSQGNFVWAMHGGAGYHDEAQDICVDPSGNIIATGNLHAATGDLPHFNDVYFPGVLGTNNEEIFVIKIDNAVNLPLTLTSQITNPTCYGISDGSIEITVSGGTPTYTYFWSAGGQTTEDISNLAEGIYNITVSDASGDYLIDTIELIQPSSLVHSFTTSDVTVYGGNDGSIDLTVSGGSPPYYYTWSNGANTQDIFNLSVAIYSVTIMDNNGCSVNQNIEIMEGANEPNPEWYYNVTSSNHTILLPQTMVSSFCTDVIESGDYVGAFFDSLGTLACAGYIKYEGIVTSLSAWGTDTGNDGFVNGEEFKWKVWRSVDSTTFDVDATYALIGFPNTGNYLTNGMSGLDSLTMPCQDFQTIVLPQGWSIFSTYINPSVPDIADVCATISSNIDMIKGGTGLIYWPSYSINQIGDLTIGQGYQAKTVLATNLLIYGTIVIPELTPISINAGWNLIGYLRTNQAPIDIMLSSISNEIEMVKTGLGLIYWPLYGINNIGDMLPGQGYQMKLQNQAILTYPAN